MYFWAAAQSQSVMGQWCQEIFISLSGEISTHWSFLAQKFTFSIKNYLKSVISNNEHTFWKTQRAIKRIKWHVVMTSTSLRIGNIFILQLCFKPLHINLIYNYLQMCLMICFYKNLTVSIWFTQNHIHISFWHKKLAMFLVLTDSSTQNN